MTLGELKTTVLSNCDIDSYQEYAQKFIDTYNESALFCATHIKPKEGKITIIHDPLKNSVGEYEMKQYNPTEGLVYSGTGKAYYMEVSGNGTVTIASDSGSTVHTFVKSNTFTALKGFCEGATTITFSGDNQYLVRNIAIYENVYSTDVDDIPPYTRYIRYDLTELATDFGWFTEKDPTQGGEYPKDFAIVTDYIREQNAIFFNRETSGMFTVYYKTKPAKITSATLDSYVVPFEEDVSEALVYRICERLSFLDDEPQRSAYFFDLFNNIATNIQEQVRIDNRFPAVYKNTSGW